MRIGVIAPPWFTIPPEGYGGIERAVFDLVESLVDAGQDVTLFAPANSHSRARLEPLIDIAPGLDLSTTMRERLLRDYGRRAQHAAETMNFDVVYDHTEAIYDAPWSVPLLRTIHGPVSARNLERCRRHVAAGEILLGISDRQVALFDAASAVRFGSTTAVRFAAAIHNPVDVVHAPFYDADSKDIDAAYIGRCHPEKGPVEAIEVALRAGLRLRMAMRVSAEERPYFEAEVKPLLKWASDDVEFVGEVNGRERDELFGRARVLLFTSVWEEPFGLVLTESLARGTPVAALKRGSAPEILRDGTTGILCSNFAAMADRLPSAMSLSPAVCRDEALRRFDREHVATRHLEFIREVVCGRTARQPAKSIFDESRAMLPAELRSTIALGAGTAAA